MLNKALLEKHSPSSYFENYNACYNARGLYDSMQFVLRLRPDIHQLLGKAEVGLKKSSELDFDTVQAFSTYLHETIHWWQHIGSISGLILSLSYPAQSHVNSKHLNDYIKFTGPIKPIVKYNQLNASEFKPSSKEFQTINIILNNFFDIEFFKRLTIQPKSANSFVNDHMFESVGHSFHIAYSCFLNVLSSSFDRELSFLPDAREWVKEFSRLSNEKVHGYYHGSPINLTPIGLHDLYEGQARFSQMQYLYLGSGGNLTWEDFEDMGMLNGIYYSAFAAFLELTSSERPESLNSPIISLFLLVLDITINPSDGFPFDIDSFESFIPCTDPGLRFSFICNAINTELPELKSAIVEHSASEYYSVSKKICDAISCHSPLDAASKINEWATNEASLIKLMSEEKTFEFDKENLPIRLIFSRFIRYQQDKLNTPEFFCWPGVYTAGDKSTVEAVNLFKEHQSLFSDKADGDIYPRTFPDKEDRQVKNTFDIFYSWIITYDLTRQWIAGDGPFDYDYLWLTSKHNQEEVADWAKNEFKNVYGVDPDEFKTT